jgi:hypothetical protein
LAARHLEANGIATVILGSARDIVEHCGVPRFVFSDFPLGNSAGKPNDPVSQRETLALAIEVLATARGPRTTLQSTQSWSDAQNWKQEFFSIEHLSDHELARRRAEFDQIKTVSKDVRNQARD